MREVPAGVLLVDARGMRCPWPALRLARAMREAADVLLVADDPKVGGEVAALAAQHGWRVDAAVTADGQAGWQVRRLT